VQRPGESLRDEAQRRSESDSTASGASDEGAELGRGDPIPHDLCVGRMKPLETEVEVRSSADPQIACATCV